MVSDCRSVIIRVSSSLFHSATPTSTPSSSGSCRRITTSVIASPPSFSCASFLTQTHTDTPHFNSLTPTTQFIVTNNNSNSSSFPPPPCASFFTPNSIFSEDPQLDDDDFKDDPNHPNDQLHISNLGLPQRLLQVLQTRGVTHLFPIQRAVLVPALEGRDIIVRVKTPTGKALAFGIPIIQRLTQQASSQSTSGRLPRVLVLTPTRVLAKQVEKEIRKYAPFLNTVCAYGGVSYVTQQDALSRGVDIVVGTPGRIIDLMKRNSLKLEEVDYLVLDEADQMLSFGFEEDVEVILENLPSKHQSMLFSATLTTWVKKLTRKYLDSPLQIDLIGDQEENPAEGVKFYAISATSTPKLTILGDLVTVYAKGGKTIVFTRTKQDAGDVSMTLTNSRASEALHGDITELQRERTLNGFRQGNFPVLVATDIASRGLDIPNVDLVIHYEHPSDPETFVHRSSHAQCAGKEGTVVLMFTGNQRSAIRSLERDVGCKFEFVNAPAIEEGLESSAEQMVATLDGVLPESFQFFTPSAQKFMEEQGRRAPTRQGDLSKKKPYGQVSALGRHICMSAQKARRVVDQIRGRSYEEALMMLELMPYRACYPVLKLVYSAAANGSHNNGLRKANLVIRRAEVNEGATVYRLKPAARGRSHAIRRRSCHISIVMEDVSFHEEYENMMS